VTTAVDGLAALEAVRERAPDIVVSDVMMPRLDGVGLVRELRKEARTSSLPVILLSARVGEESAIAGLDAGSDDYLAKPFSAKELLARVRTHVELARNRRAWTAELERANRELDAFSYSVSHDLRAPLRAIGGFTQVLADDYGALLDAPGKESLQRILDGVKRMAALIEALLGLARISRAKVIADSVDLSAMAERIVSDLRQAHPARAVTVTIEEGLVVRGDRALLDVVLVNLIGNAWKFTSRRENAHIEIGRGPEGELFVRDDGAGFDSGYASRLFAPFQRLHRADEFEGTGVGLATVQRVIHRHGGSIRAEAAVGRGATFYFSIPPERGTARLTTAPAA
jgi:two-component system sensor histidine kinase/response regulator